MSEIRLTIRGVIFALFPQYDKTNPDSDEMINQTVERLAELDRTRPEVILMPEPENIYDHKAVRAYCNGSSIGYVAHEETMEASRLFDASHPMVKARIVEVEVKGKGNLFVVAELPAEALVKPLPKADATEAWRQWRCSVPQLPIPDTWKDCRVLEFQMKNLFDNPDEENIKSLKNYLSVWIDKSLHDFSVEAMQLRKQYISKIRAMDNGALEAMAKRLERQYTAICSGHRMTYRMKWWKELQQAEHMEHYWDQWRSGRKEDNLWSDLHTVDTQLRRMPDGLYAHIGDLTCLFSAMRYRDDVSRTVLWEVYTLLLLRERICRELGIAMKPLPLDAYGTLEKEETFTPELTDARLAKAVEECQPFFWAKSAWAVVFCVCRDYYGVPDNVSAFEKRIRILPFSKPIEAYSVGTIQKTISNNDYMKRHIDKWEEGRALTLAHELKSFLDQSF
ncbi:MAG: hypothetical protein IJ413_08520 [Bacteroides sp.]|nr:hypothetical protein [Bacteroides sp.]